MSLEHSSARQRRGIASAQADDNRVMTFAAWCELNGFSPATGRRIINSGKGPKVLQLSDRRIGIRHDDNPRWQDSLVQDA
jgi:hypothetical protein